jgi:two-component system sensor histidine kinase ChvG
LGDTDTLDLDPRSFSTRLNIIELEVLNEQKNQETVEKKDINIDEKEPVSLKDILRIYLNSKDFGKPFTFTQDNFSQFKLTTIKNVMRDGSNVGFIAIIENANDIKAAIDERETFILRTAIAVGFVISDFLFCFE